MLPKDMAAAQRKHGRGGIYGPVPLDVGPPCCQICPGKVYHELSLLQLDSHIERSALGNFHSFVKEFEDARRQRRRRQQGEIDSSDSRKKHKRRWHSSCDASAATRAPEAREVSGGACARPRLHVERESSEPRPNGERSDYDGDPRCPPSDGDEAAQQVPEHTLKGGATTPPNRPAPRRRSKSKRRPLLQNLRRRVQFQRERRPEGEQLAESLAPCTTSSQG